MNHGVMPFYEARVAAVLVPMTYAALMMFLSRDGGKRYPPRYMRREKVKRKVRILSSAEILSIRDEVLRGDGDTVKPYVPLVVTGMTHCEIQKLTER